MVKSILKIAILLVIDHGEAYGYNYSSN